MSFGDFIDAAMFHGYAMQVRGFFNVEGGRVGVANQYHPWCECTLLEFGPGKECDQCGRHENNYASMVSGDGDGIYVVAEIVDTRSNRVVGAIAVFDYQYQIANEARSFIEMERVPAYPLELARIFAAAKPIALGTMTNTGAVYFADSGSGLDSDNAIVDVHIVPGKPLEIFGFAEEVSSNPDDWAARLAETQGFDFLSTSKQISAGFSGGQAMYEALGVDGTYTLPSFVPRVIAVLDDHLSLLVGIEDQIVIDDWRRVSSQFAGAVGTSHTEVMRNSTVLMNALLAREWDRAAGDEVSLDESKKLLFAMWTWAYQGAILGDHDCKQLILANSYSATSEEISELLRRRGLYSAARKAARGELPDLSIDSPPVASFQEPTKSVGLTKSSGSVGLSQTSNSLQSSIRAKFCTKCGTAFVAEGDNFCPSCGAPRA